MSVEFDLSSLDGLTEAQERGVDVEIMHPATNKPLGIVIRVSGPDSKHSKVGRSKVINDRLNGKVKVTDADRVEYDNLTTAAHAVMSWSGVIIAGKSIDLSIENAMMVFTRFPWIFEQVFAVCNDRAKFAG
jgi:hypothetical protein